MRRRRRGSYSFATKLVVRQSVDLTTAATLGNWRSIRVLSETYSHAEGLAGIIDDVFGGKGTKKLRSKLTS